MGNCVLTRPIPTFFGIDTSKSWSYTSSGFTAPEDCWLCNTKGFDYNSMYIDGKPIDNGNNGDSMGCVPLLKGQTVSGGSVYKVYGVKWY